MYLVMTNPLITFGQRWLMLRKKRNHSQSTQRSVFNIDTVAGRADEYTKRRIKDARNARQMENIIFNDCPVTVDDIQAANDISGRNLGALKGKTTHQGGRLPRPESSTE